MPKDLFEEKLALIFEYNRNSPLFVRAAAIEIEKNNLHKAVRILSDGLADYPDYPTAYILLGKAEMLSGNFDQAEEAFKKGSSLVNSKETLYYYSSELEKRRRASSNFTGSRRVAFFTDDLTKLSEEDNKPSQDESSLPEREKSSLPSEEPGKTGSIEERLDDLAKEISSAKIAFTENPDDNFSAPAMRREEKAEQTESAIASETLAKIYMSQGKFKEALNIYKILQRKSPDRKEIYQSKIDEIEQQLGSED